MLVLVLGGSIYFFYLVRILLYIFPFLLLYDSKSTKDSSSCSLLCLTFIMSTLCIFCSSSFVISEIVVGVNAVSLLWQFYGSFLVSISNCDTLFFLLKRVGLDSFGFGVISFFFSNLN